MPSSCGWSATWGWGGIAEWLASPTLIHEASNPDLWTKPFGLSQKPAYKQPVNCSHQSHHHHLLLFSQLWADRAAAPPIDQNLGLVMAAQLKHGGKFSLKSLTCGHFLYKNLKKLSASGGLCPPNPPPGALPLDPAGGPPFRLALRALAMVPPLWQILDPPLLGGPRFHTFHGPLGSLILFLPFSRSIPPLFFPSIPEPQRKSNSVQFSLKI